MGFRRSPVQIRLVAVLFPVLMLSFVATKRWGRWDRWLGLDHVERVAARFDISYAEVDRQVGPDEPAWPVVLDLISRYSGVELPEDREPRLLARGVAALSGKVKIPGDRSWGA